MKLFITRRARALIIIGAALAAGALVAAGTAAQAEVTKRDHRTPPIVRDHRAPKPETPPVEPATKRDHRTPAVVRDHRGEEGRTKPSRNSGTICAGWAC